MHKEKRNSGTSKSSQGAFGCNCLNSRMKAFKSLAIGTRNRSFRLGEGLGVALVQENLDCSPDIGLFTRRDGTTQHEGIFSLSAFKSKTSLVQPPCTPGNPLSSKMPLPLCFREGMPPVGTPLFVFWVL